MLVLLLTDGFKDVVKDVYIVFRKNKNFAVFIFSFFVSLLFGLKKFRVLSPDFSHSFGEHRFDNHTSVCPRYAVNARRREHYGE
tara:strand:+ start:59 stop:310 length:252 start_codon:yes stop_codon:yes gene_type:complete